MSGSPTWPLSSIDDLASWLFEGLNNFYNKCAFSDKKYALYPIELDDMDYVSLQIVRQVQTFDRSGLAALAKANEQAMRMWRPRYGLDPLLDMLGIVQELGSCDLGKRILELTAPQTLNHLVASERERLYSALVDVMITDTEFHYGKPLYDLLKRIVDPPAKSSSAIAHPTSASNVSDSFAARSIYLNAASPRTSRSSLPTLMLARAIGTLIRREPSSWRLVLRDYEREFESFSDPTESPLGSVFFEVERNFSPDYFKWLLSPDEANQWNDGQKRLQPEEVWILDWLFLSRYQRASLETPLTINNAQEAYWIGFASRSVKTEIKKGDLAGRVHQALEKLLVKMSGLQQIGKNSNTEPHVEDLKSLESPSIVDLLKKRLGS